MSLLTIIQDACDAVGIARPQAVTLGGGEQTRVMYQLAQSECEELARRHDWGVLVRSHSFAVDNSVNAQPQSVPADMRKIVPGTMYRGDSKTPLYDPVGPSFWAYDVAGASAFSDSYWRLVGSSIWMNPKPATGTSISYEYISKNWMTNIGTGLPGSRWQNDGDETVLPEELVKLGLVWRWKKAKGFDYGEDMTTYERQLERYAADDSGLQTIIGSGIRSELPDGMWPAPIREPL